MKVYFDLRDQLCRLYPSANDWRRVVAAAGVNLNSIDLTGSAINVWTEILDALKVQKQISGLVDVLSRENPDVAGLAREYEEVVKNGGGGIVEIPGIQGVEIGEEELTLDSIVRSLDFSRTLSAPLLSVLLSAGPVALGDVDRAFSGQSTILAKTTLAEFRRQSVDALKVLLRRRDAVRGSLVGIRNKINSIERSHCPIEPALRDFSSLPYEQQTILYGQQMEANVAYRNAVAKYHEDKGAVGGLRAEAEKFGEELAQLDVLIANQNANVVVSEQCLVGEIGVARDRDLFGELNRILNEALTVVEKDPLVSFWTTLGADRMLDMIYRMGSQQAVAGEASVRFSAVVSVLVQSIENRVIEVVKGCLVGPAMINRILTENQSILAALTFRLDVLPVVNFQERIDCARVLLVDCPQIDYGFVNMEKENEIEVARSKLMAFQASIEDHIRRVQLFVEGESRGLLLEVERARADISLAMEKIEYNALRYHGVVEAISVLWTLIEKGKGSVHLPVYLKRLCASLPVEFERRFHRDVGAVVSQARDTSMGAAVARGYVGEHLVSAYFKIVERLQSEISDSKNKLIEIDRVKVQIEGQYQVVADGYRIRLGAIACLSFFPGVNLLVVLWGAGVIRRMSFLLSSRKDAYVELGRFAYCASFATLLGTVLSTVAGAVIVFVFLMLNDVDVSTLIAVLTLASSAAVLSAFHSFLVIKASVRDRDL